MAWSGEGVTLKSPLEQVWRQIIPQGHDTALRNAFYNVAAGGFVAVAAAVAWNVYVIFQPFVRALLWAVLVGSALHPAKSLLVSVAKRWLHGVSSSSSSLTVATFLLPFQTLDALSEVIGRYVVKHVRTVVVVTVVLPVVFILIHYTPTVLTSVVYWIISSIFYSAKFVLTLATSSRYIMVALVVCYIVSLFMLWHHDQYRIWLTQSSVAVWLLAGASVSGWLFPASVTQLVFAAFCGLLLMGLGVEVMEYIQQSQTDGVDSKTLVHSVVKVCKNEYEQTDTAQSNTCSSAPKLEVLSEEDETVSQSNDKADHADLKQTDSANKVEGIKDSNVQTESQGGNKDKSPRPDSLPPSNASAKEPSEEGDECVSNFYLKAVFMACVLVELWRHHYLLGLLPVAVLYYTIKKTTSVCLSGASLTTSIYEMLNHYWTISYDWFKLRRDAILPPPVRGILKVLGRSESASIEIISGSLDVLVSCFVILAMLVFIVAASIFLTVQIQGESMQLVSVSSQVINSTIVNNPQFLAMLPDDIGDSMNSALDNAYHYGRDWIAKWVRGLVEDADEEKALVLEKQVLELWDRVYQAWVISPPIAQHRQGPVVTSQAVADTFDNLLQGITNSPGVISLTSLTQVMQDNVGTILSVLESVWSLMLSNLSLVMSLATTSASVLLGSSLSLLNAIISAVVFLTALFYVLSSEGDIYKPVAVITSLAPGQMNSVGVAVETAVNDVFSASIKMGVFYGLWTWLIHSIFATNIVYIPAVLGALFGAVPLLGTYWACVPGMLELWFWHNNPTLSLLLLVCQLAPLSCVDTAIYAEIEGGGHPYLTGLAIGGGIFCWGAEGAILGPLLLCILLVAANMYSALIKPPVTTTAQSRFSRLRRNLTATE